MCFRTGKLHVAQEQYSKIYNNQPVTGAPVVSTLDWDAGGFPFEFGILTLLKHACGEQQLAAILAVKGWAGVAPDVDLWKHASCTPPSSVNKSAHSAFETWRRQHHKGLFTSTVSVSVSFSITVKVYHGVNGNGPFERQNGFCTLSARQTDRHHRRNVILWRWRWRWRWRTRRRRRYM